MSTEAQSPQEVSGQSAFWILASLAAAAVVLPSTSSRMSGRDLFGGNIDLVRCIPGVSLLDSICDTILLCLSTYRVLRAPKPVQRARRALPKVSVVAAKLMLSIFTVFPQIIKAISLKGVPATQFCAFVFFYAATTRLLIDLCGLEPEEPFTPPDEGDNSLDIIVLLVLPFQAPFQLWIWHRIVLSVKFQLSDTFYRICTWSSLALNLMGRLFALPIETPETSEALTEEGERPTDDSQQGADAEKDEEEPPVKPEGGQLGRLGGIVDRWLVRFLLMDTTADISITLTVFNLITTIIYYLVYFDGTGTVNPGWTSVLG
ncbi:hypothetical protein SNK03_002685 [Fusarium graminearum]|nr:hypothetical protein FG05_02333 [Fusarium graminearum]